MVNRLVVIPFLIYMRYKSSIFPLKEKRNLILFSHLLANKVKCKLLSCKINICFIQKRNKKLMSH